MAEAASGAVIVVGSANVDLTVRAGRLPGPGETVTGGVFRRLPGGKGANQAVAAARYGARSHLVAAVGDDPLADEILDDLRRAGVLVGGVARLPGTASGVALIVVDVAGENQIAVASGANGLLSASLVAWALGSIEPAAGSVCLVGFEIGDEAVMAAAGWARERGLTLVVNPAPARPLPPGLADLRPILTPNRGEATALTGLQDPEQAAAALRDRTRAPVVVTLGAAGAIVVDGAGAEHVPALPVSPIDATGAGDAFNGILAAELAGGTDLRTATRSATAGASLSTLASGAQTGLPTKSEVVAAVGD